MHLISDVLKTSVGRAYRLYYHKSTLAALNQSFDSVEDFTFCYETETNFNLHCVAAQPLIEEVTTYNIHSFHVPARYLYHNHILSLSIVA
jgi:hypothetical protein